MSGDAESGLAGRGVSTPAPAPTGALEAAAAGLAAALLYAATACRDLGAGDAGELLLAARTLGIPHPPGYPLWVWLAALFGRLAPGPFPARVALLSAVSAAVGLALLYRLIRACGPGRLAAALAVAALAVTPALWSSATSVEVYALSFAVDVGAALAACAYARRGGPGRLFVTALLAGLALVSHQTAVLLLPALAVALWPRLRAEGMPWRAPLLGLAAGLLPFLWLPLRSAQHPLLDWGHDASLVRWAANLSRACYGGLAQNPVDLARFPREIGFFASFQWAQWGPALPLALAGLAWWARRAPRAAACVALACAALPLGLSLLLRFEPDPVHTYQLSQFLAPMTAALAVALAVGLDRALRARWLRAPAVALALAWVAGAAAFHQPAGEPGGASLARRYGQDLLNSLPPGATLFVQGDNETFALAWLQKGEGVRPDVRVIHRKGYVFEDPYRLAGLPRGQWPARQREVEARLLASGTGPFFCSGEMPVPRGFQLLPEGLVQRIARSPDQAGPDRVPQLPLTLTQARATDFVTRKIAAAYLEGEARAALRSGPISRAVLAYRRLAYVAYDFPEARYDLGRVLSLAGEPDAAREEVRAALRLAPQEPWLRQAAREMGVRPS